MSGFWKDNNNYTMLCDFYELTMANGYFESGMKDQIAYFDMFYRTIPDKGGYALMMGTEQLVEYIEKLKFDPDDIEYLRTLNSTRMQREEDQNGIVD